MRSSSSDLVAKTVSSHLSQGSPVIVRVNAMESAAYQQTREAIEKVRVSIAALEEHFEHFHASGSRDDLTRAQVKLQDLFQHLSSLQTCLGRFAE